MAVDLVQLNSDIQEAYKGHWIYDYKIGEDKAVTPLNEWSRDNMVGMAKSVFKDRDVMVCDAKSGLTAILFALNGAKSVKAYETKSTDANIIRRAVEYLGLENKVTVYEQNPFLIEQGELFIDQECVDSVDFVFSLVTLQWKYFNEIINFEGIAKAAHLYARKGIITDFPKPPSPPATYSEDKYIENLSKYFQDIVVANSFVMALNKKDV